MKVRMYAIYDSKIGNFMQPFFMINAGAALRGFEELTRDDKTTVGKYPADFTLFELGEWNDENGHYSEHQAPVNLGLAVQFSGSPEVPRSRESVNEARA